MEYQLILRNCLTLLRGLLSTGLRSNFSCEDLFKTLNAYSCATCSDFAGFVYIITCKRVCFLYFSERPEYFPLQLREAERKFCVRRGFFSSLPMLRSIPGHYLPNGNTYKTRYALIDPTLAHSLSVEHYGSAQVIEQCVADAAQRSLEAYLQRIKVQPSRTASRRAPNYNSREARILDPRRFIAVICVP